MNRLRENLRVWDLFLIGSLVAALSFVVLLVRQRNALLNTPEPPLPEETPVEKALRETTAEREAILRTVATLQSEIARLGEEKRELERPQPRPVPADASPGELRDELALAYDRLRKAYEDLAEMEKQLIDVCRQKNDLESQLAERRPSPPRHDPDETPKIDGFVMAVSDKVNLVLIDVGSDKSVEVGYKFTVYRGDEYVSRLVVDRVESGWSACRELTDFRKREIQQGDNVSTRIFR